MESHAIDRIVLATGNPGKVREIGELFAPLEITFVAQSALGIDAPAETGATFAENAVLKATFAARHSGLPAIADDSGICVDALGGRPGVRSARYAGEGATDDENLDLLLDELQEVPEEERGGHFVCAAAFVCPWRLDAPVVVEKTWRGRILCERRGSGGFGYDPVFLDPASGRTGAELSPGEKNAVSHRGQAFRRLREIIGEQLGSD